jgi:hypothetical protein
MGTEKKSAIRGSCFYKVIVGNKKEELENIKPVLL